MSSRVAYRICPLCEATCGLAITLEGDRVKVIRGDRDNPFSQGFICPKGTTLGRLHEDPDRLRRPLVRGANGLEEASWEEAFARVERGLAPLLGAERDSVAIYIGNPNVHHFENLLALRPLVKALGSRNVYTAATVDQMPKHVSSGYMFGAPGAIPVPDIDRTDHLLLLGADPYESNGSLATAPDWPRRLEAIRARGGRVVVVDPRRSKTAENADEHVPIRPGTDAALLVAMVHVLFDEDLVRLGRLEGRVAGLERLRAAVAPFDPESVAGRTGVAAGKIRRLARDLAAARSASVYGRLGTHTVAFGTLASWAVDVLNVVTGNLDRPGGAMFPMAPHLPTRRRPREFRQGRWTSRVRELQETIGELPVVTLVDEIETPGDGQVRALITVAGNPVLTTPDAGRLDRALASLQFMVSLDHYVNETSRHADVILPPPSSLERSHYDSAFTALSVRNYASYSLPALERDPETPGEFEILVKLTAILSGFGSGADVDKLAEAALAAEVDRKVADPGSPIAGRDAHEILRALDGKPFPERFLDLMLRTGPRGDGFGADPDGLTLDRLASAPHGIDFGPLEPRVPDVISTPSGMIEVAPEPIVADLPRLQAALEGEPNGSLRLVGRRQLRSNNSWLHNVDVLVKGKERCTLLVHPDDAARLGLVDGQTAVVTSAVGAATAPVEVNDSVMAGVVSLPYGWGHGYDGVRLSVASRRPGTNANLLTDTGAIDPLSGNAVLNGTPVTVTPA